ncbi:MAG: hypothetical protein V5A43_01765 [Haloarculaceae archaeon]
MFDAPVDAWYVWLGLGAASLAVLATAIPLTSGTPSGAARVADAIDEVATSPYLASERVTLDADELRLGSSRIAVKTRAGVAHASLAFGPITPVDSARLEAVLRGRAVGAVFESREAFRRALRRANERLPRFRPAPDRLRVRRVSWGEVDATLVG